MAIESKPSAIVKVCELILLKLKANNFSQEDIFAVHLALEEALINAIKHGNKMNPKKEVHPGGFGDVRTAGLKGADSKAQGGRPGSRVIPVDRCQRPNGPRLGVTARWALGTRLGGPFPRAGTLGSRVTALRAPRNSRMNKEKTPPVVQRARLESALPLLALF